MTQLFGAISALMTPFKNGELDEGAFADFVAWQIGEGINALVPVGTTGESATLSHKEHERVIEICIEVADKRVPVIAGAGSNSTHEAVQLAAFAQKAGADAVLCVSPYYNKPNQEGLYQHFKAIADSIDIDVVLYNIPGRSVIDMVPATVGRLVNDCKNITAIKDATGSVERITAQRIAAGEGLTQLSGDDPLTIGMIAQGAKGVISVASNIAPKLMVELVDAALKNDFERANVIQDKLYPLCKALFVEPNPVGAKYAASQLGLMKEDVRLPLVPATDATKKQIDDALAIAGLK